MIKKAIQLTIGFFQYIFSSPEYWLVTAHWIKIILTWMIGYMFAGIFLTAGGIYGLSCIDYLFTRDFFIMLLAVLCGGVSLFHGLSLLYQVFYNIFYAFAITFYGKTVDAQVVKVNFRRKKVRGNDLSRYDFTIVYRAPLEDGQLQNITQGSSVYKSHFYADTIKNKKTIKIKYWRRNPKKAKILWYKS
jgi:hypothetical protein